MFLWVNPAVAQKRVTATVNPNVAALNDTADIYDPQTGRIAPAAGKMNVARERHVSVAMKNGKVLIAGGYDNRYLKSAEIFDPETSAFTRSADLIAARAGAAAAPLPDGNVLIAGGYNGQYLNSAEIYDPVATSFTSPLTFMIYKRYNAVATVLDSGEVLLTGGFTGAEFLATAEIYDPEKKSFFSVVGIMDDARIGHTATRLANGKVLVTGGCRNSESGEIVCNEYLDSAEIWDPSTDRFTPTGSMKFARADHTATLLPDGRVLIAGGSNGLSLLATAEIYDPATGKFTQTGILAIPRKQHTATALPGGKVLIAGGFSDQYLDSAEVYDPATGSFSAVASPLSAARLLHSAASLADGRVLIAGGQNSDLMLFDVNFQSSGDDIAPNIFFSADSKKGFVPYAGSGAVLVFSPENGELLGRIQTGGKPNRITPLPGGDIAVVSALDNKIFIIDTNSLSVRSTYTFSGLFGFGSVLELSPDGRTGYISSTGTGEVVKFEISSGNETGRLKGMKAPAQITVTKDGGTLLIVDTTLNEIVFADASSMTAKYKMTPLEHYPLTSFTIFNKPVLNLDGTKGVIGSQDVSSSGGSVIVFKPSSGDIEVALGVGYNPAHTILKPDGSAWIVFCDGSIAVIPVENPGSGKIADTVQGSPLGGSNLVLSPDSRFAFYTGAVAERVYQHDLETLGVVGSFPVGDNPNVSQDQPSSVAFTPDFGTLAVVNFGSNELDLLTDIYVFKQTKFSGYKNDFTGVSVVNLSDEPASVTFTAMSNAGAVYSSEGVSNPVTVNLPANAQRSIDVAELFNLDTEIENSGHLIVESDNPGVVGFSETGKVRSSFPDVFLSDVQGIPVYYGTSALRDFIIPENPQLEGGSAELTFVNPNFTSTSFDVTHYGTDGTELETKPNNSLSGATRQTKKVSDFVTTSQIGQVLILGGRDGRTIQDAGDMFTVSAKTFTSTKNMETARHGHSATTLRNHKVLIAGGKNGFTTNDSAVLYDPVAGTFTLTNGTMNTERYRHTATLLPNGKVLLAGGQSAQSINRTAELFDPHSAGFVLTPGPMTTPRDAHTATLLSNGLVLLTGGMDGVSITATAEIYDPATSAFSPAGTMTVGRAFHTATILPDGKVLIAGGFDGDYLDSAEIYDPATGSFLPVGPMKSARSRHAATLLADGKVLITGGVNGSGALDSAEIFDPNSQSFKATIGTMTAARSSHTSTLVSDGQVLIAGGTNGTAALETAETYNPDTGQFSRTTAGMNVAREGHTATLLEGSDQGYLRATSQNGVLFTQVYSNGGASTAINGIDVEKFAGITRIYSPQFAILPDYMTLLNVINANQTDPATVTITLHAPDGTVLSTPVSVVLPSNGQIKGSLLDIFRNDPDLVGRTGWVEIASTVDRIVGTVSFTNSADSFLAAVELSGTPMKDFVFPLTAEDSEYATGIALLNAGDAPANIHMELWGPSGTLDGTADIVLPAKSQQAQPLGGFFQGMQPHRVSNVRIRSDQPIHPLGLLYSTGLRFLSPVAAVPYPVQ